MKQQLTLYPLLAVLLLGMAHAQNSVPTKQVTCGGFDRSRYVWANPVTHIGKTDFCVAPDGKFVWATTIYGTHSQWKHGIHELVVAYVGGDPQKHPYRYVAIRKNSTATVRIGDNYLSIEFADHGLKPDGTEWVNYVWEGLKW